MSSKTRIRIRRGTSAEWSQANPLLLLGELGLDTTVRRIKAGDGVSKWNALPFLADGQGISGAAQISDLIDVDAGSVVEGSLLVYNSDSGKWVAGPTTAIPEVLNGGNF